MSRTKVLLGRRLRRSGARLALFAGAAVLMAVWLTLGGLALYERQLLADRIEDRNELLARVFADGVTRNIEATSLATATVADLIATGLAPDGPELRASMDQTLVNLPFLRGISLLDSHGQILGGTDSAEWGQMIDVSRLGGLPERHADLLGPFVPVRRLLDLRSGLEPGVVPEGVGFLPLLRTVHTPTNQRVHVVALINAAAFANFLQVTMNDSRAAAALVSYGGRLIAATAGVERPVGQDLSRLPPFARFLPKYEHAAWVGEGLRVGRQIAAFRVSATRPLMVMVEFDAGAATAEWFQRSRWLLPVALVAALLIGALTAAASRSIRARESARRQLDAAQAETVRSERDLSITIMSLQELIFRTDAQGAFSFVNDRWRDITGSGLSEARGVCLWDHVRSHQRATTQALFSESDPRDVRTGQITLPDTLGRLRSFKVSVRPLRAAGQIQGFAGSAVDITGQLEAQAALQEQLNFTEELMEISPLPKSVVDLQGRFLLVNRAWEDFTGLGRKEVIGHTVDELLAPGEHAVHQEGDRGLKARGGSIRYEAILSHRDGSQRNMSISKVALPGLDGQTVGVLCLMVDVTEFRKAEQAIREARDAAEDASRSKSEFIANISHELRTPLQSIIGFSELGLVRGGGDERLSAMFGDIQDAGQRMLRLVNGLLDVSKIDSAIGTIHLERADLRVLIRQVLREVDPLLAGRQQSVRLQLPEQRMLAKVDPLRFQQVVRNVLANAIKFSPVGARIDLLGGTAESGELEIIVSDAGPGIPEDEIELIFEAFVQSSATKDGSGGTGLGLAICRKIITAHGGSIHAENLPGGGSAFHVRLPARDATDTAHAELDSAMATQAEII